MAFTKKWLLSTETTLSPSLETPAFHSLVEYLNLRFTGTGMTVDDKPQVVVCFDASGSGKTTTVREATRKVGANRVIISSNLGPVLAGVLSSCYNRNQFEIDNNGYISASAVEEKFEMKFNFALENMLCRITSIIQQHNSDVPFETIVDKGRYPTPDSNETDNLQHTSTDRFEDLCSALDKKNLVIHVDDCQLFFKGVTLSTKCTDTIIPAGEIMSLALRCFSKCIAPFTNKRNIVWVFSGTRPNLLTEITLTSGLDTFDISKYITDFKSEDIQKIFNNYYDLSQLTLPFERLSGPPKLVYFFLKAASNYSLLSSDDLLEKWTQIEESAIALFKTKIDSTFKGNLDLVARNLCILHSSAVALNQDFIDITSISRHLIDLIEAGLLRIHKHNNLWRIFTPNRFLIQIFNDYVQWYTWERLEMLKSLIQASSLTRTQNGKVFEYLFALELCNTPNCKLWNFLSEKANIQPIPSWSPTITQIGNIGDCFDQNCIYVMVDPDRGNSKIDVVFFAQKNGTNETVRVLVQLTIGAYTNSKTVQKIEDSFDAMLDQTTNDYKDYCLFIGPKCILTAPRDTRDGFHIFIKEDNIADSFQLPVEILSDPAAPENSVGLLVQMAEKIGDVYHAKQMAGDFTSLSITNKRVRLDEQVTSCSQPTFTTMEQFYAKLRKEVEIPDAVETFVMPVFNAQLIGSRQLSSITDAKLEKYGIIQGGLRDAILKVLGKE
ncbi:hypothetical protein BC833DRAFT_610787 [Globomyces pollinis-pini]|nr:hypothetical protein BC833DRAFT_610787 [Globomyces pollinis-pini]